MRKTMKVTIKEVEVADVDKETGKETKRVIPNRDKGKTFLITEMSAMQAEAWATRAFLALGRSGIDIPEEVTSQGLTGLASYALRGLNRLSYDEARPLLDQMIDCVAFVPDPKNPDMTRSLIDDDTEEVSTILTLRAEVFKLHLGFFLPEGRLNSQ